jgi:hypothetical protein
MSSQPPAAVIGMYREQPILAWLDIKERGSRYEYAGIAIEDKDRTVALAQLREDEILVAPGLIYRRISE